MKNSKRDFFEPWNTSTTYRYSLAQEALRHGKKIVLYYATMPDDSTFRYRGYNLLQQTLISKRWQLIYFFKNEEVFLSLIYSSAFLVINRNTDFDEYTKAVIDTARRLDKKILYDIDDCVFDLKYEEEISNVTEFKLDAANYNRIMRCVDGAIVTNKFLQKRLSADTNKPAFVIRNTVNKEQLYFSKFLCRTKQRATNFTIGYFSGSRSHFQDLRVVAPEISLFLENHPDARFTIVGYIKIPDYMTKFVYNSQLKILPPTDFRDLQRLTSEVDVNIAPLLESVFTNCKSELKFFEAAIVETTTIASPTYAFKNSIKDGSTGFLCSPGRWYSTLEYLYNNPTKNHIIAKAARKYCLENYNGQKVLEEIEATYDEICSNDKHK